MQKIIRTVTKNRWFVKRVWVPMTFIQEAEVLQTSTDLPLATLQEPTFEEIRVGYGQRVCCMVALNLKNPTPVLKYMTIDRAESLWIREATNLIIQNNLASSDDGASHDAMLLLRRYSLEYTAAEAINDFYKDAL